MATVGCPVQLSSYLFCTAAVDCVLWLKNVLNRKHNIKIFHICKSQIAFSSSVFNTREILWAQYNFHVEIVNLCGHFLLKGQSNHFRNVLIQGVQRVHKDQSGNMQHNIELTFLIPEL